MLLVEDNDALAEAVMDRMRAEGHAMDRESDGAAASKLLQFASFDIVLLDINLPGASGYEILHDMRARGNSTPVMLLTARSEIDDRILGLDAGADDYMVKPFDLRELSARCRVLARRRAGSSSNLFTAGNFSFDRGAKLACIGAQSLDLRAREVQLLEIMLNNLGKMLTKEEVADKLYTFDETPSLNAVEQLVARLRKRLEGTPVTIKTARGLGYLAYVTEDD